MNKPDSENKIFCGMSRREFLERAGKLGLVVVGSGMVPNMFPRNGLAQTLKPKETTEFKVRWKNPLGKKFPPGTSLAYFSWEPWCRPYQMKVFTEHTGVSVSTGIFKSTKEMLTKLGAGAAQSYDIFSPSQYSPMQCVEAGWFQEVNLKNIPHYKDLHPAFQNSPYVYKDGKHYVIPFVWGTDAIIYNTEKIPVVDSLSILYDPKYKGRLTIQDVATNAIPALAIYLGFDNPFQLTEDQLQKVKQEFKKIKPQIRTFWSSDSQANALLVSGEVWAIFTAHLAQLQPLLDEGMKAKWSWPKEGSYGWFEGIAISSFTKNKEAAEIFADWCIGEEFGAMIANDINYYPCSTACKVNMTKEEIQSVYLDNPQIPTKTYMMQMPKNVDRYQEIWSEMKAL